MSKKQEVLSPSGLPLYLGLGRLDQKSVTSENGVLRAAYVQQADLVYKVEMQPGQTRLDEYYQGKSIQLTVFPNTLQKAFLHHWASTDIYHHPRFLDLINAVMGTGNIYVTLPNRPQYVYYPAGMILGFRMPLDTPREKKWQEFKKKIKPDTSPVSLVNEGAGMLFWLLDTGEVKGYPVTVLDFSALLVDVQEAASWIAKSGIIETGKKNRLVLTDGSNLGEGNMSVYLGDPKEGYLTYTVVPTPPDMKIETIARSFFDASLEFLQSLERRSKS